jgi:hypothetical protein
MMRRWTIDLLGGVFSGQVRQIEPLLDLMALPIASEVVLLLIAACLSLAWLRLYVLGAFVVLLFHITTAAISGPGLWNATKALSIVPSYIFWKLWTLPEIWRTSRSDAAWVRTERQSTADGH